MAKISDGTTEVDLGLANETIDPGLEKSSKRTSGGNIRSITAGERFKIDIDVRLTQATYRTFINLMKNGASNYFFEPNDTTELSSLYPSITWPLNCNIYNITRQWDNRTYYYVSFKVESISYV